MTASSAPGLLRTAAPGKRVYCQVDNWFFDPRYTDGACPICGWAPPSALIKAEPAWLLRVRTLPWDLIALGVLFVGLVIAGVFVGMAAGINLTPRG
jgi:hypothetical protein